MTPTASHACWAAYHIHPSPLNNLLPHSLL